MTTLRLVPASGTPIEVTRQQSLVGRDPGCDIVLADGSVSRKHARLEQRGSSWVVIDQGSANGTYLNSQRVAEVVLKNGQELRFGSLSFRVELPAEDDLVATVATRSVPEDTVFAGTSPPEQAPPPLSPPPPPAAPPPPLPPGRRERFGSAGPPRAPVPQMPVGPAPPRSGKGPFFWIATGCCGCLLLVLVLAGLIMGGVFFLTQGAAEAVHAQLKLIQRGDVDEAYAGLSQSYRSELSRQDFERLIAAHPGLRDNADATFWRRSVHNDQAVLSGVLTPRSGRPEQVTFKLVKEGGAWKIEQIRFGDDGPGLEEGGAPGPPGGDTATAASRLEMRTVDVRKDDTGAGTKVTIKTQARGFALRPEGRQYRIDLVGDLETLAPGGERIESLCRKGFYRVSDRTGSARGAYADFRTDLTFEQPPPGSYTVRITLRDQVGGGRKTHTVAFALP